MLEKKEIYVSAFFCQQLLQDKDDVFSAIRIVDVFNISVPPQRPDTAIIMPPLEGHLVIIFKSPTPANFVATVGIVNPNGKEFSTNRFPINLPGGVAGNFLAVTLRIGIEHAGIYWCNVLVDGEVATRVPLQVTHTRESDDTPTLKPQQPADPSA